MRILIVVSLALAVIVTSGLVYERYKPGARKDLDFFPQPEQIVRITGQKEARVVAGFFVAGNLARLRPEWPVTPYLAFAAPRFGGGTVLFLSRQGIPPDVPSGMAQAGWPRDASAELLQQGKVILGFDSSDKLLPLTYCLVKTPALD